MNLFQKQQNFPEHSHGFLKSTLNLEHFQKKMTRIPYVFPKLRTPNDELT